MKTDASSGAPQFTFTLPAPPPAPSAPPSDLAAEPRSRRNKALWFVGIALCLNAAALFLTRANAQIPEFKLDNPAFAQSTPTSAMLGARGIYMMPAQLGPQTWGVYLLDVDSSTICVYRTMPETNRFKLMATRSFKSDRFFEDYNNERPTQAEVAKLVEEQRKRTDLNQKNDQPTVDQTPKRDENLPDLPAANLKQPNPLSPP